MVSRTMVALMEAPDTAESVAAAVRWGPINNLRHARVLVAWLAALRTCAQAHEGRQASEAYARNPTGG